MALEYFLKGLLITIRFTGSYSTWIVIHTLAALANSISCLWRIRPQSSQVPCCALSELGFAKVKAVPWARESLGLKNRFVVRQPNKIADEESVEQDCWLCLYPTNKDRFATLGRLLVTLRQLWVVIALYRLLKFEGLLLNVRWQTDSVVVQI